MALNLRLTFINRCRSAVSEHPPSHDRNVVVVVIVVVVVVVIVVVIVIVVVVVTESNFWNLR